LANTPGLRLRRHVRFGVSYASLLTGLAGARFYLMQLLRRAQPGQWLEVESLVQRARQLNVLHSFWLLPPGVFLEHNGRSLAGDSPEHWSTAYRPFVEAVLAGPLHWQGLLDLAYQQDRLAAVRITELGALALYQRESFTPPVPAAAGPA